uniref:Putative extracellular protein TR9_068 n=1 Tax=Trebouxia lynnae TaxID=1825957 RepID=A0A7L9QEI4_9CHLO|nr:putative extracellular protein TR9_068 [Trebouxia lynnae]
MHYWILVVLCGLTVTTCEASSRHQILERPNAVANVTGVSAGFGEPGELALCDCEFATGPPDGLSCDKEGWFISNFEREGSWLTGGGLVPLSRARCCRPCLPSELPDSQGQISPDSKGVAIVSIGCHKSTGSGSGALKCEPQGSSFVTGFTEAIRVSNAANYFYPVGAVECCTPSVLLSTGEAWELERCDCSFSTDINCGEMDSHRLLQGFERWRITALGLVPIAPAQCCKTCLSKVIHPLDSCSDLNFCSGHGVCNLGSCDCFDGYGGPDCGNVLGGSGGQLPEWATSLIIFGSCVLVTTLVLVAGRVVHYIADRHAEEGEDEGLGEPLILRIDQDDQGSVGSEDTTRFDSDDDMPPIETEAVGGGVLIPEGHRGDTVETEAQSFVVPVANGIQLETRRRNRRLPADESTTAGDVGVTDSEDEADSAEDLQRIEAAAAAIGQRLDASPSAQTSEEIQVGEAGNNNPSLDELHTEDAAQEDDMHGNNDSIMDAKKEAPFEEVNDDPTAALLRGAECNVCMNRPVQVVVIPCGHATLCRRCSRRLTRCPVCRKEIVRRQRIYLGG